jgi:site-specific recombinase XerD
MCASSDPTDLPDSLAAWLPRYQEQVVAVTHPVPVVQKTLLHLRRFHQFLLSTAGHDRLSTLVPRDVRTWQQHLHDQGFAPTTVNQHLSDLAAFVTWASTIAPASFPQGIPTRGLRALPLPPLEPRALTDQHVRSLKNLCDRLDGFYRSKDRRRNPHPGTALPPLRHAARPWRDRAIVFVLLSTGLRREELVSLNLSQVLPDEAMALRQAHRARLQQVRGKGHTERTLFLSADARLALADYLERERDADATPTTEALFLSARQVGSRAVDGRLTPRSINTILARIGRWHDAEFADPERHISPLRPHDLRHTFAFQLADQTGADAYELERRLGHRSQRYIQRYTNPPEAVAAAYVEDL